MSWIPSEPCLPSKYLSSYCAKQYVGSYFFTIEGNTTVFPSYLSRLLLTKLASISFILCIWIWRFCLSILSFLQFFNCFKFIKSLINWYFSNRYFLSNNLYLLLRSTRTGYESWTVFWLSFNTVGDDEEDILFSRFIDFCLLFVVSVFRPVSLLSLLSCLAFVSIIGCVLVYG